MSDRIDEYHGEEAKVLTTDEVERWQAALGRHWGARIGPLEHEVVIESERILATTRALETAQRDALEAQGSEEGLVRELNSAQDRALARLRERDEAQARAEKAEREYSRSCRDNAELRCQLEDATSVVTKMERESREYRDTERKALHMCSVLEQERNTAERERDEARRELAELALEVGYGERPEGQGGIIHADGKTLAGAWLLERKGRDQAEADRDIARATVSELVGVLHAVVLDWDGADLGTVKAGLIDDARVILTKAFKEES